MRRVVVLFLAALLAVAGLTAGASARTATPRVGLPALVPVADDALTAALEEGRISAGEYALERARSLFRLGAVRSAYGDVARPDPHAATGILRDLALRVSSMDPADAAAANAILARPNQGGPDDGTLEYNTPEATPVDSLNFRIHYVTSGQHAATAAYATAISGIMEEVYTKEVTQMGWLAPKSDLSANPNGGDGRFDVYLGNVGADSIYGYCTVDRGQTTQAQTAYCVLDNDFTTGQFPGPVSGLNAAKVTGAHEFHHAIQFAYDVTDDYWLLEATATWMEDEVYDDINDNYQYLSASSLARPQTPADSWVGFTDVSPDAGFQYGQFIWMRYLNEKWPSASNNIVRDLWSKTAAPGSYSVKAIGDALAARGTDFATSFADFAARNAKASRFYEEGTNYEAEVAPVRNATHTLSGTTPGKGSFTNIDHLTSRYVSFKPGAGVADGDQMTIAVDLGSAPMQKAMVVLLSGSTMDVREIPLVTGEGNLTVPFGNQTEVVLVTSNASNRNNGCATNGWTPGYYSCGGTPTDDNQVHAYAGVIGTTPVQPDGGGTPPPVGPDVANLKASPNPFTPNGDGNKDKTKVSWKLGDNASVTLELFKGSTYKGYFFEDLALQSSGTPYFVKWNGKIGSRKAPAGTYTFRLTATSDEGTTVKEATVKLKR